MINTVFLVHDLGLSRREEYLRKYEKCVAKCSRKNYISHLVIMQGTTKTMSAKGLHVGKKGNTRLYKAFVP